MDRVDSVGGVGATPGGHRRLPARSRLAQQPVVEGNDFTVLEMTVGIGDIRPKQAVVSGAAVHGVVASTAIDLVFARAADQRVATAAALDVVIIM